MRVPGKLLLGFNVVSGGGEHHLVYATDDSKENVFTSIIEPAHKTQFAFVVKVPPMSTLEDLESYCGQKLQTTFLGRLGAFFGADHFCQLAGHVADSAAIAKPWPVGTMLRLAQLRGTDTYVPLRVPENLARNNTREAYALAWAEKKLPTRAEAPASTNARADGLLDIDDDDDLGGMWT